MNQIARVGYSPTLQVRALIIIRRQMFGRIFGISLGVRAHFAPGPCALARRSATREKILGAQRASSRFMNEKSCLSTPHPYRSLILDFRPDARF